MRKVRRLRSIVPGVSFVIYGITSHGVSGVICPIFDDQWHLRDTALYVDDQDVAQGDFSKAYISWYASKP